MQTINKGVNPIQTMSMEDFQHASMLKAKASEIGNPVIKHVNKNGHEAVYLVSNLSHSKDERLEAVDVFNYEVKNSLNYTANPYQFIDRINVIEGIVVTYPKVLMMNAEYKGLEKVDLTEADFITVESKPELAFYNQSKWFEQRLTGETGNLIGLMNLEGSMSDSDFVTADYDMDINEVNHHMFGSKCSMSYAEEQKYGVNPLGKSPLDVRQDLIEKRMSQTKADLLFKGSDSIIEGFFNNTKFSVNSDDILDTNLITCTFQQMVEQTLKLQALSIVNQSSYARDTLIISSELYQSLYRRYITSSDIQYFPTSVAGASYLATFVAILKDAGITVIPLSSLDPSKQGGNHRMFLYNKADVRRENAFSGNGYMIYEMPMFQSGSFNQARYFLDQYSSLKVVRPEQQLEIVNTTF